MAAVATSHETFPDREETGDGILSPGRVALLAIHAAKYRGIAVASEIVALIESHERLRARLDGRGGTAQFVPPEPIIYVPPRAPAVRELEAVVAESIVVRVSRHRTCGVCRESGHNRQTCPKLDYR